MMLHADCFASGMWDDMLSILMLIDLNFMPSNLHYTSVDANMF